MNNTTDLLTVESIRNCVYTIRGQQVMLDYDLASIYGYEVKRLNEQVKRNINRFPEDFMFQLTMDEVDLVKSQNATSNERMTTRDGVTGSFMRVRFKGTLFYLLIGKYEGAFFACKDESLFAGWHEV